MVLAWFDPLSAGWQAGFYVAAVIAFALGALTPGPLASRTGGFNFIALGLALFFPARLELPRRHLNNPRGRAKARGHARCVDMCASG
jgi:hypothetical protein